MTRQEAWDLFETTRQDRLVFRPSRRVQSVRFGDSSSPYKGEGLEFEEVREFRPGDRVRHVHPAASSKAQELMVRRFTELREALVLIALDVSPSMFVREKMRTALLCAGVVAHTARGVHLPLGFWALGGPFDVEVLPRTGETHFQRVADVIVEAACDAPDPAVLGAYRMETEAGRLETFVHRGAFLFVISDFLEIDPRLRTPLEGVRTGYRVVPIVVQDELEYSFPLFPRHGTIVPLSDPETGEAREVWIDEARSARVRDAHERRFAELKAYFGSLNLMFTHAPAPEPTALIGAMQEALY